MNELGIERLCVFDMPPVEFVSLTADLGCSSIGTALTPMGHYNPHDYPEWSLRHDAVLRREMRAAMQDRGVRISLLEGFGIAPSRDVRDYAGDLDILTELGGMRINLVSVDRDQGRAFEQFAIMAELAAERELEVVTEVGTMGHLDEALAAIEHVNRPNFRLLIDTMHFFRLGGSLKQFAAVDPLLVGYVQLCDAPSAPVFASYREEALYERRAPGDGELPLGEFVHLLRPEVVVSLEVPQRSLVQAGWSAEERLKRCIDRARSLWDSA